MAHAPDADAGSASPTRVPAEAGRQRYVVGVFSAPSEARRAIAGFASDDCDVLVVSDAPLTAEAVRDGTGEGRVAFHRIDPSGTLAPDLAAMLSTSRPFAALGVHNGHGEVRPPPGTQRLFQNLVHHLATGAAVVVVHAPGAEQQLWVSRALLDAKCDILLTHDVLEPASTDDCCKTCSSPTCGRLDPSTGDPSPPGGKG